MYTQETESLYYLGNLTFCVFQQKGWAPKREETERSERSELENRQKLLPMERFQRIPVNVLEGRDFAACKANVFLRVYLMPDIFLHLTVQHQQVSGKAIKNQHIFVHIQHSVWEILFSPTTAESAFNSPDVSSVERSIFCFSYCGEGWRLPSQVFQRAQQANSYQV